MPAKFQQINMASWQLPPPGPTAVSLGTEVGTQPRKMAHRAYDARSWRSVGIKIILSDNASRCCLSSPVLPLVMDLQHPTTKV